MERIGWTVLDPEVPGPLGAVVEELAGTNGEWFLTMAPAVPPVVERKGLLGRSRREVATWGVAVQHWDDRPGGRYSLWLTHPAGPPVSARTALPGGLEVEFEGDAEAMLNTPAGMPAAEVATMALGLARACLAGAVEDRWRFRVDDTMLPASEYSDFSAG